MYFKGEKWIFPLLFVLISNSVVTITGLQRNPGLLSTLLAPQSRSSNAVQFTTGKVFLIGGATKDTTASIYNALRESTGKANPKISVVISAAASLADGLDAYYVPDETSTSYEQLFINYGFQPSVVLLAQDNYQLGANASNELGAENIAQIQDADVVFFNGGDQSRHSRSWFNDDGSDSDIMQVLRARFDSGLVVAGTSAGLAIQSDPTFGEGRSYGYYYFDADLKPCQIGESLVDDREGQNSFRARENGGYMKGFGFVRDAIVDSHFDARGRFGRLVVAMKTADKLFGIGVDEDTTLYLYNNTATAYGTYGVWIIDGTEASFPNATQYFEASNVRINFLSEGDVYNVETKKVITSKPIVTGGSDNVYESDDVFAVDEGLDSITSLATSIQTESVGYSSEKRPTARVVFFRTNDSKFYKNAITNAYAIENLRLDIGTL